MTLNQALEKLCAHGKVEVEHYQRFEISVWVKAKRGGQIRMTAVSYHPVHAIKALLSQLEDNNGAS